VAASANLGQLGRELHLEKLLSSDGTGPELSELQVLLLLLGGQGLALLHDLHGLADVLEVVLGLLGHLLLQLQGLDLGLSLFLETLQSSGLLVVSDLLASLLGLTQELRGLLGDGDPSLNCSRTEGLGSLELEHQLLVLLRRLGRDELVVGVLALEELVDLLVSSCLSDG